MAALPEILGSFPSAPMVTHSRLKLQFQGIRSPLLASSGTRYKSGTDIDLVTFLLL